MKIVRESSQTTDSEDGEDENRNKVKHAYFL